MIHGRRYTMNKEDFDGTDAVFTSETLILNEESEVKYWSGDIDSLEMSGSQGEPIEIKGDNIDFKTLDSDEDVIGVLSEKSVVNFTEENGLMVGYRKDG